MEEKKKTFEERVHELEGMAESLDSGKLGLEESMELFEKSIRELDQLDKQLKEAMQRFTLIREGADGKLSEESAEDTPAGAVPSGPQVMPEDEDLPF